MLDETAWGMAAGGRPLNALAPDDRMAFHNNIWRQSRFVDDFGCGLGTLGSARKTELRLVPTHPRAVGPHLDQ